MTDATLTPSAFNEVQTGRVVLLLRFVVKSGKKDAFYGKLLEIVDKMKKRRSIR